MATNLRRFIGGISLVGTSSSAVSVGGEIEYLTTSNKLNFHNGTTASPIVTEAHTATLTNKTIDAASNTISNIANANISASAGIVYSKLSLTGSIVNADIASGAAIAYSKLNLAGSIQNSDLAGSIAYSKLVLTNSIVNADINSTAAIAYSKLSLAGSILNTDLAGSIAASKLVGSDIATVGTITTGTWSATTIALNKGGTGQTTQTAAFDALAPTTTKGDIIVRNSSNNVRLGIGTDGQVPVADSTQTSGLKWATLQQGAKNYITYNNFENNATTGWSLAHSALTSNVPTSVASAGTAFDSTHGGTTASSLNALAIASSGQLAGSYSLSLSSPGATTAGDMLISQAYTIDKEDQAKVMTGKFYYSLISGTGVFSGTSSNSFSVWIYDVTNAAWIQPAGVYGMVQSSGVGYCTYTWQTPSNMTQFQVAIICNVGTSGAINIYLDDFTVGPQTAPFGPAMTDWQSYTPTLSPGFGTATNNVGYWRRVGDSIEIHGTFNSGTVTATVASISLPSGVSIDTTKLDRTNGAAVGYSTTSSNNTNAVPNNATLFIATTDTTVMKFSNQGNGTASNNLTALNGSVLCNAGNPVSYWALIPISGWSSNVQMSSDTDTRVVAAMYQSTTADTTASNSTVLNFDTKVIDTHGAVTTGSSPNWKFTAPASGNYRVSHVWETQANASALVGKFLAFDLIKNGTQFLSLSKHISQTTSSAKRTGSGSAIVALNAGDTVQIRVDSDDGTIYTMATSALLNFVSIERLSGPAVVAATESVYAKANSSGTTVAAAGTTVLVFGTVEFDTHGQYSVSTGKFTCPTSGVYEISGMFQASGATGSGAINNSESLRLQKNGSDVCHIGTFVVQETGSALTRLLSGTGMVKCVAGDTLNLAINNPDSAFTGVNNTSQTWVSFERIGN